MANIEITYRQFTGKDKKILSGLIKNLYQEDSEGKPMTDAKIEKTFRELTVNPEKGNILLIENGNKIIGYCLLINYWSNEYGGNILAIDELYIKPDYRCKKIGSNFIKSLVKNKFNNCVALQLETMPANKKAETLYLRLGFKPDKNKHFMFEFE